jgi:uncharacterized cupin superfamily protein
MVGHWDDIPWETVDVGNLRWERQRLARAVGAPVLGLSRYRVPAGGQLMPAHVHVDEDESVVLLAGEGLVWHEGSSYPVSAGAVVVHPPDAGAHTLLAGDDGLEVLIFGGGSPTGLTRLPRSGITRVGDGVIPPGADPFANEPPLEAPAPQPRDVPRLDDAERVQRLPNMRHLVLPAGEESYPPHCHSAEHEIFCVLDGAGVVTIGDDEHAVSRGSVVSRPAGTGVAHHFTAGDAGLRLLAYAPTDPRDIGYYPRTKTVFLRGIGVRVQV